MAGRWLLTLVIGALVASGVAARVAADDEFAEARARMLEVVQQHATTAGAALEGGRLDPAVLEAMGRVPRHAFVPDHLRDEAYDDRPLPIGFGQTISQPFIVALMTDLLDVRPGDVVLEVGTGSGYQAAVLAALGAQVYSIEIVPELGRSAGRRLAELGYDNAHTRVGDGYYGWQGPGPFDGIVVTAAASHIPPPLIQQLKPGGRMVIPVGGAFFHQQLMLVAKDEAGHVTTQQLLPVRFVPLTREQA
jgi:protein-L-isoaspartate(D-aspartate) O-methyltransferase